MYIEYDEILENIIRPHRMTVNKLSTNNGNDDTVDLITKVKR